MGDQILAVDALLLQFFTLFSYIMDGFAYAGESLVGRHIGARQLRHLKLAVRLLIAWGLALTVLFTGLYAAFGNQFLHIFTDKQDVIAATGEYMGWVLAIPICGFAAFLFDGIFIGATATRTMRNAMFVLRRRRSRRMSVQSRKSLSLRGTLQTSACTDPLRSFHRAKS